LRTFSNSMRGYGPEDRTLLEYDKETEETVITDYGQQIATQIQDIFISGSICTSPRCKSTAQKHNPTKLHFGYSNEKDRKAPRTLYFVDCKTGACRDKLLRIVVCRTIISYEEHLQRLEEVSCKERTEALAQLVARLPHNNPMHQLANLATPTTTSLQQQQAQQTHTEAAATLQQTQVVIQPTPLVIPMTSIGLEHQVAGTKLVQQIKRKQRKRKHANTLIDPPQGNHTVLKDTSILMLAHATKSSKVPAERLAQLGPQASSTAPIRRTRSFTRTEIPLAAEGASSVELLDDDSGDATDPQ
jgi:hypothetical protein